MGKAALPEKGKNPFILSKDQHIYLDMLPASRAHVKKSHTIAAAQKVLDNVRFRGEENYMGLLLSATRKNW